MATTKIRPDQAKTLEVFDDQKAPGAVTLEDTTLTLEGFLQGVISQVNRLIHTTETGNDWHADLTAPLNFEGGAKRGVDAVNQALHDVERKRLLTFNYLTVDVPVPAATNVVVLDTVPKLPTQRTAAVGAVDTLGVVVAAHTGTFGNHSLDAVTGANALNPKNIVAVVDANTRAPISSGDRRVFGLLQSESATDPHTTLPNSPNGVQISFVVCTATGDGLEAAPAGVIGNQKISYAYVERVGLQDFDEQVLLSGASESAGSGGGGGGPSATWIEDQYAATNGQVTFLLSAVPTEPQSLSFSANGVEAVEGTDYSLSGLTLTWLNATFSFEASDTVVIRYK